jgi:NifB/MoaA-like Fe-S oxidoreductase
VVPVGLTRFHRAGCRTYTDVQARGIVDRLARQQNELLQVLGVRFAYLSDEWYLRLGEAVPPFEAYDGLDLTENGVGLVRRFVDAGGGLDALKGQVTLVTGTLFAPLLAELTSSITGVEVVSVVNRLFGETVTVAGLLTAEDVLDQLQGHDLGDTVVLPAAMFGGPEGQSLDGKCADEVGEALGCEVRLGHTLADVTD